MVRVSASLSTWIRHTLSVRARPSTQTAALNARKSTFVLNAFVRFSIKLIFSVLIIKADFRQMCLPSPIKFNSGFTVWFATIGFTTLYVHIVCINSDFDGYWAPQIKQLRVSCVCTLYFFVPGPMCDRSLDRGVDDIHPGGRITRRAGSFLKTHTIRETRPHQRCHT